jgi:hypothetical protein
MTGLTTPGTGGSIRADPAVMIDLLRRWLSRCVVPDAMNWLEAEIDGQLSGIDERRLGIAFGLVGRKIGRSDLLLSSTDLGAAQQLRARWRPDLWSADEAARLAILLATHRGDDRVFAARIERLCATAELTEHIACLKGFAIFPAAELLRLRAREAVRSSAPAIFHAIASHNPYPFDYFDDAAWNQMVVKCVFNGLPIETVSGLSERRNPELVRMLRDLVSERHAAGRVLPDTVYAYLETH